jgi:hypothetical protein
LKLFGQQFQFPDFLRFGSLWELVNRKKWRIVEWTGWILGMLS